MAAEPLYSVNSNESNWYPYLNSSWLVLSLFFLNVYVLNFVSFFFFVNVFSPSLFSDSIPRIKETIIRTQRSLSND